MTTAQKIGFIGLGIMGAPMAGHLLDAGHTLFVNTRGATCPSLSHREHGLRHGRPKSRGRPTSSSSWCPTRRTSRRCCSARTASLRACPKARRWSTAARSIRSPPAASPDASPTLGCGYVDAPVSGGEVGAKAASLTIMCGGDASRPSSACSPCSRRWARTSRWWASVGDGQVCKVANQIIVALNIAAVGEALVFAAQGRRRPGQGAAGADGRLRVLAHPGGAWRTHDQAHLRAGLSHRAAPEGPEPGHAKRPLARRRIAANRRRGAADERLRRARPWPGGPFGAGASRWKRWPSTRCRPTDEKSAHALA